MAKIAPQVGKSTVGKNVFTFDNIKYLPCKSDESDDYQFDAYPKDKKVPFMDSEASEVWRNTCRKFGVKFTRKTDAIYPDILASFQKTLADMKEIKSPKTIIENKKKEAQKITNWFISEK